MAYKTVKGEVKFYFDKIDIILIATMIAGIFFILVSL